MTRPAGTSVRVKLALSYAGLVMLAGIGLLVVVWAFLLRYVPDQAVSIPQDAPGTAPSARGRICSSRAAPTCGRRSRPRRR